jgi:hypothetical protein
MPHASKQGRTPMKGILSAALLLCALQTARADPHPWVRADMKDQVPGCRVQLYEDPHFQGARWSTTNSWAAVGWEFNDKISSIKVRSGVWQFFRGDNFQHQIQTLFPGNYATLTPTLANAISSFRCVKAT